MRGRIEIAPDTEAPPDWWADVFRRRQRKLRALVVRHLTASGRWISTTQVRSVVDRYEAEEIDHALETLAADGVIETEERFEPLFGTHGRAVIRAYWRIPTEEPEPCPD